MKSALLYLALLVTAVPVAAQTCGANGVSLQVLGSAGPQPVARRAASSHLLWVDGRARVLVDAGSGAALRLAESGAQPDDLDVLLLTSLYADHTGDLPALIQAAELATRTRALPVFGPPGSRTMPSTVAFVRDLFDATRGAWRHLGEHLAPLARGPYKIEVRDVRPAAPKLATPRPPKNAVPPPMPVFANDRLTIRATAVTHETAPALSVRIETGGKRIVFAGEARPDDPAATALAADADLLVVYHGTAGDPAVIGRLAKATRSRQLLLVHRSLATLGRDREEAALAAIRRHYDGTLTFAEDLGCYRP